MAPIVRVGYVTDADKLARQRLYNSSEWKQARKAVLDRDGHRCRICHRSTLESGRRLEVVHRARSLEAVLAGAELDLDLLATMCSRCRGSYFAGDTAWPD